MKKIKILLLTVILMLLYTGMIISQTNDPPIWLGDVNGDRKINIIDALRVAQFSTGIASAGFNPDYADVDQDQNITIIDALQIAQFSVGQIEYFTGDSVYGQVQKKLEKYSTLWWNLGFRNYELEAGVSQFFSPNLLGKTCLVQVEENTITSVVFKDTGAPVPEEDQGMFKTVNGLFDTLQNAIDNRYIIRNLTFHNLYGYPTSINLNPDPDIYDGSITYYASGIRSLTQVKLLDLPLPETVNINIPKARVIEDTLSLTIEYGGGCFEHHFAVLYEANFQESLPVQINLYLYDPDAADPCKALVTRTVAFDLNPIAELYNATYRKYDTIQLNIYENKYSVADSLIYRPQDTRQ